MGEVYLAEDTRLGLARQVAIKTIRTEADPYPDQDAIRDAERLFRREMQAIAQLDHPYILPLYDYGEARVDTTLVTYMVMPLRSEGSLTTWLQKQSTSGSLSFQVVAHFVEQAGQALQYAHAQGLIHQDVKPANFLVRNRPEQRWPDIQLADFGIVRVLAATATASQSVRGTAAYMAPEQWAGQPVFATDQYALAVMAYLLLTRRFPFTGSMHQIMHQHLSVQPLAPSIANPAITSDLDTVILCALQKSPKDRFASITAFANALKQAIQPAPSSRPDQAEVSLPPPVVSLPPAVSQIPRPMAQSAGPETPPIVYVSPPTPPISVARPVSEISAALPTPSHTNPSSRNWFLRTVFFRYVARQSAQWSQAFRRKETLPPSLHVAQSGTTGKRRSLVAPLVALAILVALVVASSIGGLVIHQNQVNDVRATADAQVTATAQVIASNPCPLYIQECGSFSLALLDSLQASSTAEPFFSMSNCQYTTKALEVSESSLNTFSLCDDDGSFSDFIFEVQMTSIRGDCGGMEVEYDASTGHGYLFDVCPGGIGSSNYMLYRDVSNSSSTATLLAFGRSSAISAGANTLAIAVVHGTISLYVNQHRIGSAQDSAYVSGSICLIAEDYLNATTVDYTTARVWT